MSSAAPNPHFLRLVGEFPGEAQPSRESQRAKLEVIKENRLAANMGGPGLDPNDPRWILAMQTQARLQGAMLTPERRDELLKSGKRLGLRPFEANLVIAIVQDKARTGLAADQQAPLPIGRDSNESLSTVPAVWPRLFAAVAAAMALAALLIRWLAHQ
jgi:hypothetical protein